MQDAVGDRARERLDAHEVARRGRLPAAVVLRQHLRHDRVAVLAQRADGRQRLQLAQPAGEAADLLLDDLLRPRNLARAGVEVARDHLLEVVDVVQRHPLQLAAARVDVARHRDVDQQQRPPLALGEHLRELVAADDRVRRGGGGDDDVGGRQLLGQPVEADDRAAEALREAARAVGVAVGDEDRAGAPVGERLRGQLAGFAGAEDHHVALAQVPEQLDGEPNRRGGDAHVAGADAGLRAHPLAGCQRGAPQAVAERPGAAGLQRRLEGALDLSLDLGLADDHRFQARGHPVEVAGGVAVARRVDLLRQLGGADEAWRASIPSASSSRRTGSPTTR